MSVKLKHSILRRRVAMLCGAAAIAVTGLGGAMAGTAQAVGACANADTPVGQLTTQQAAAAVECLVNQERASAGLPRLTPNGPLTNTARDINNEIVRQKWWCGNYSDPNCNPHIAPSQRGLPGSLEQKVGAAIGNRITSHGYCHGRPKVDGENAVYFWNSARYPTAREAVAWWMHSAPHRANILNPKFTETGVWVIAAAPTPLSPGAKAATFYQDFGAC
jgi:Cysteine-rich secretory protein family